MKFRYFAVFGVLLLTGNLLAGVARAQTNEAAPDAGAESRALPADEGKAPEKADAYYHFSLGHMYEEMATMYGRADYANRAIEEYKLAMASDPSSDYLVSQLAELYAKIGRIRDAVLEAQEVIKRNPSNVEAHRLLGRIYLRSLGDMQAGAQPGQPPEILQRAIEEFEEIIKLDPGSVDDHLLLGRLYRLNNDPKKAESEFQAALKLQPYSEEAVTTLAYLYDEQGNPARASQLLDTIPNTERSSRLYLALGYTYEQQKDYKRAIDAYRKAVDLDGENLDAMRGLAQNLLNDGQTDAALQQYKEIVAADPQDPQSYLRMAEIYRRNGQLAQALEALKKAQTYVQDSVEVSYNLAVIYQAQGRFDEAIQILQDLVQKSDKAPDNASPAERNNRSLFLERLGGIYRDTGNYPLALETFRKMTDLGDDNAARGYQETVDTYREAKQWPQAVQAAQEAVNKLPNDRNLKLTLAAQLADTGHGDQAITDVKALLKDTPEDREVYLALAQMCTRLKRFHEAEEYIAKAEPLAGKPEEKAYVWFVWGSVMERQRKYDEAEVMFKKALAGDPRNSMVLNYLGYMLADRGVRLEEALGYIKKAVELDPQNGAYLDSLGWAYFKQGNYELAEENLRRASERIQNDPTVQDHLGELYARTGRLKLAAMHWERAIEEWNKSVPADVDQTDFQRVQRKLESTKLKLAKQQQAERRSAEAAKP
jgi:tetratricopeptide (TPR) repeat protein